MSKTILKNGRIVNEGKIVEGDVLIVNDRIQRIAPSIDVPNAIEIDATDKYILPGVIDDQVHFREPGLTHKASIYTESCAAVVGGVTSFMEMPNTKPAALTQELLADKYDIAHKYSAANYSFFMGAGNDNLEEVLKTDEHEVCGVKIFMGSSTGNMLVDNEQILDKLFANVPLLIATHCEDEETIRKNTALYKEKYGEDIPFSCHPEIRNHASCLLSSSKAIELAKKHNTRLHILHISTAQETDLFRNDIPLSEKRITSEVCVHHLSFDDSQYDTYGSRIKCNPAIKSKHDQDVLWEALLDNRLDIIATDHAPHTVEEKAGKYLKAPSGLPLIQHTLQLMMTAAKDGKISVERVIEKMCHAPAECFLLNERGYIREGYYADIVVYDPNVQYVAKDQNVQYKCGWTPLHGHLLQGAVDYTIVNGNIVYQKGKPIRTGLGARLRFR